MAIPLYNPRTQAFAQFTPPASDLPLAEMLLLNILIELQTLTQYLAVDSPDEPATLRNDIVSNL